MTLHITGMNKAMNSNVKMETFRYYHSSSRTMTVLLAPQETRKQGIRWGPRIWDQKKFLNYNVQHILASQIRMTVLQMRTD